jgi:hypothetical protein
MRRTSTVVTGVTALAATAILLGSTPTAAQAQGVSSAKSFSIESIAVPQAHDTVIGPDYKACCGIIWSEGC